MFHPTPTPQATKGPDWGHVRSAHVYGPVQFLCTVCNTPPVTSTEKNLQGDALCFMVKAWTRHKTTEALLNNGWRLAAAVGWWFVAVGGWQRLEVLKGFPAVLNKKKEFLRTALRGGGMGEICPSTQRRDRSIGAVLFGASKCQQYLLVHKSMRSQLRMATITGSACGAGTTQMVVEGTMMTSASVALALPVPFHFLFLLALCSFCLSPLGCVCLPET